MGASSEKQGERGEGMGEWGKGPIGRRIGKQSDGAVNKAQQNERKGQDKTYYFV